MTEAEIQKTVFDNLKARAAPGVLYWHTPNNPESRRKSGFRAGVSDVAALHRGKFYALELKKPGGNPTVQQMEFISQVNSAGGFGCIATGLDQAIKVLETWGLLRGVSA